MLSEHERTSSGPGARKLNFSLAIANITVNDASPIPIYEQICRAIRTAITAGELPPNTELPTSRELAAALKIGRNTVVTAYSRLAAEGFLLANKRRGTWVAEDALGIASEIRDERLEERSAHATVPQFADRSPKADLIEISYRARSVLEKDVAEVPVAPFAPYMSDPALYPRNPLSRLLAEEFCHSPGGDLQRGLKRFQVAMAAYLRHMRGVFCEPAQIVPITGLESALDLTARVMIDPGDWVYIEDPTSDIIRQSLRSAGAQLVAIPSDNSGADISRVSGPPPRLIFASPSVNFPMGRQMSEPRREALLRAAADWKAVIFECDALWELSYTGQRLKAMQGYRRDAAVLYFGSLSQTLGPHIRVGYLVVPPMLVDPFNEMARRISYGPEPFVLSALATFIEDADYAVHAKSIRSIYADRLSALVEAVRKHIDDVTILEPSGGLHVTILFNDSVDEKSVCRAAADRGLSVTALSRFYHDAARGSPRAGIVLGFGTLPDRVVETMVRRLAEIIGEIRSGVGAATLVA